MNRRSIYRRRLCCFYRRRFFRPCSRPWPCQSCWSRAFCTPRAYEAARKATAHLMLKPVKSVARCIALLSSGDTSMKDCATGVNEMLALWRDLQNPRWQIHA